MISAVLVGVLLLQSVAQDAPNYDNPDVGALPSGEDSVGCFGDFNSDKHTDLFSVSASGRLRIYLYNKDTKLFEDLDISINEDFGIENCIPGDFNYDGKLDVLVQGPDPDNPGLYKGAIHLGGLTHFVGKKFTLDPTRGQAIVLDANNDLLPDLYGSSSDGSRTFWINTPQPNDNFGFTKRKHLVGSFPTLSAPHSNAFIDLDGDCLPDLFLDATNENGQRRFEVWLNHKTNDSATSFGTPDLPTQLIPPGTGQASFADFDGDGATDLLFPVCDSPDCVNASIHVFYNDQPGLCGKELKYCRSRTDLCSSDGAKCRFGNFTNPDADLGSHTMISIPPNHKLTSIDGLPPMTIRVGDVNMDGFPDLLVPLTDPNGIQTLTLWLNMPCTSGGCDPATFKKGRRNFVQEDTGNAALAELQGAYTGAFFDLHDDGTLDLIVLRRLTENKTETWFDTTVLMTQRHVDAYFLTTMGSNGVCDAWCPSGQKFPSPKPYGVSQPGVTVKFTVTDIQGTTWMATGNQLPQSAYLSLQLPYTLVGVGRTNSYIEDLAIGFSISAKHHSKQWRGLIPNSQIAVFPYPKDNDSQWHLELFVNSADWIVAVITGLCVVLAALGIIILVLHFRAKRDEAPEVDRERLLAL